MNMVGVCCIDCSQCDIQLAPNDPELAARLVVHFKSLGHEEANADWFHCQGCRGTRDPLIHWSHDCALLQCCVDARGLEYCYECEDFEKCYKVGKVKAKAKANFRNLTSNFGLIRIFTFYFMWENFPQIYDS